jgi:L-amino acid N-acyltransferase YncA
MAMHLRSAVTDDDADAVACAAIYAPYVANTAISFEVVPPTVAELQGRIAAAVPTHAWLVAEIDGAVVGYAYGHPFAARSAYRWSCETSIYLAADRQRAGIGSALYTALLDQLAGRGYRTALAGMTLPNAASDRLHRSLGFEQVAVLRNVGWKHGRWHDVAWYQRDLGPVSDPPAEPR